MQRKLPSFVRLSCRCPNLSKSQHLMLLDFPCIRPYHVNRLLIMTNILAWGFCRLPCCHNVDYLLKLVGRPKPCCNMQVSISFQAVLSFLWSLIGLYGHGHGQACSCLLLQARSNLSYSGNCFVCAEVLRDLANDLVQGQYADKERAVAMLSSMTLYIDHHEVLLESGVLPALMSAVSNSRVEPTVSFANRHNPDPQNSASDCWFLLSCLLHWVSTNVSSYRQLPSWAYSEFPALSLVLSARLHEGMNQWSNESMNQWVGTHGTFSSRAADRLIGCEWMSQPVSNSWIEGRGSSHIDHQLSVIFDLNVQQSFNSCHKLSATSESYLQWNSMTATSQTCHKLELQNCLQ